MIIWREKWYGRTKKELEVLHEPLPIGPTIKAEDLIQTNLKPPFNVAPGVYGKTAK